MGTMGRVVTRLRMEKAEHMEVKEAHEGRVERGRGSEEAGTGLVEPEPGGPRAGKGLAQVPSVRTLGPPPG